MIDKAHRRKLKCRAVIFVGSLHIKKKRNIILPNQANLELAGWLAVVV